MNRFFLVLGMLLLAAPLAAQPLPIGAVEQVQLPAEGVTFVENRGQWPDEVEFLARLRGVDVWVTATGFVYDVHEPTLGTAGGPPEARRGRAVRMRFVEGRAERVEGVRPRPTYHNYFLGSDSAAWAPRVPVYEEVVLHDIYEGVSLRIFEANGTLKHAVVHAAEGAPGDYFVEVEGMEDSGESLAEVFSRAASLSATDPGLDRPALPDPPARGETQAARGGRLLYARFLGGGDRESVRAMSTDGGGSVYLGGQTESGNFPTPNGYDTARQGPSDAYLAQLGTDGSQPYGTYIGGNRTEEVRDVTHANGSVYITGVTRSPNFPTTAGAYESSGSGPGQEDAFVMRVRTNGSDPVFSTFLGGGEDGDDAGGDDDGGDDVGNAIAVTPGGRVVVGGRTYAEDFPAPNGSYEGGGDGFVVVLSGDGSALQGGTFLGGDGLDEIRALELWEGNVYVAGETDSDDFGGLVGGFGGGTDAFAARLGASGNGVIGGTYLGGSGFEGATGAGAEDRTGTIALAVDDDGTVYVSGDTSSDDFPSSATLGALGGVDAFVVRLGSDATTVLGATVFGGSGVDRARGVGIDPDGAILLAGETSSGNFPVLGADDATYNGAGDAFLIQLTGDGTDVLYGTYLGGSDADRAFGLAVRDDGTAYVVGETRSATDFPVTPGFPPLQGDVDAFVASYGARSNAPPAVSAPLMDIALFLEDEPFSVDLDPVFEDPDGDALTYACVSSAPGVAQASGCSGGTLTVMPVGEGEATVTVTASDGSGSASDAFVVTVTDNLPPVVVDPPEDATLVLGEDPLVVDLSGVFDDPEGDPLDYTCGSGDPGVASVGDCSDGTLTVTPEAEGEAVITITASDEYNLGVSTSFVATVVLDNAPPTVVEPISDTMLDLGGPPLVVDLDAVFGDADGDDLSFECQVSTTGVVTVEGCGGGSLTVTPEAEGEAIVTVTATDPDGASAEDDFIVTVVNPPPVVEAPIPDASLDLGGESLVVDLDAVFADPNGDALGYTCASSAPDVASVNVCTGGTLIVSPESEGEATVTVTASDGSGSVADAFVVTVVNPPPVVVRPIPDFALLLDGAPYEVDLDTVFVDPNGDALAFSFGVDGAAVQLALDGSVLVVAPNALGEATVTATASDGDGSASEAFVVLVTDNLPPIVVDPPEDATLVLGEEPLVLDLTGVFDDPEGEELTFVCSSEAPGVASVNDCAGGELIVTPVAEGEATVTATANDGSGSTDVDFLVTVVPDNVPPAVADPIPDATLTLGGPPLVVDLDGVFDDADGDDLTYACESDAPEVAPVSDCSDGTLTVTAADDGDATITVTATDPAGASAADAFVVTVVNPPPVVVRPIPDFALLLDGAPYEVDLDTVFVDPNGDALAFSFGVDGAAVQLALDGSVLVVAPNALGEATVTATASDGSGSASEAFVVTVTNDLPPLVVEPPADTTLMLGGAPLILDVGDVFEDPEGDRLTLSCSSGAPGVVTVGDCSGGDLTASPVSEGEALITITASDGPNSADTDFTITVLGDNAPPIVVNPLEDVVLRLDDSPLVVELGDVFADADGDGLTYGCQTSAPGVASVGDCTDGTLVVTPESEGEATVRVTATDPDGAEAADEFVAAVVSNAPPVVRMPLPDVALVLGDDPLVIDLAVVFEDPEGEGLAFECESSASAVASVGGCAGGTLTVAPVGEGEATVVVAATDPEGAGADDSFAVVVGCAPPSVLAVTPFPAEPERGDDVTVTALVARGESATLRYRRGGADAYTTEVMARDGDRFVAVIPGEVVTEGGVEYAVGARNACGFPVQSDTFALRILLPAGVMSPVLPAATEGGGYRLVSVPLALEEEGAEAVFSDFGSAGGDEWLLLQLMPPGAAGDRLAGGAVDQWYREDASAIAVSPGRAYWLIVRDGGRFNTGAGSTVSGDGPFSLDLHRGWNLVGSPFGHDVPLERVRTVSGSPVQLQTFDGAWRNETVLMRPFQGYALYADDEDRLVIEAPGESAGRSAPPPRSSRAAGRGGEEWAVDIVAEIGPLHDDNNTARVGPEAAEGRDASDWAEPPTVGDYVSVAFASPGGGAPPLTVDARPVPREGATWPVHVRSNVQGRVTLSFDGVESVPADYVVWLVDEHAASVHDLRRAPTYSVASQGTGQPRRMRLLIGSLAYARAGSGFDATVPSSYHLAPSYPNPFRATTTIQFALPKNEHVVLEVFDVVGRRVARLVDEEVEAGYHSVVWDGRSSGAATLASGVYIYRLRAGSYTATERAVLAR